MSRATTREQIIEAADRLFYQQGYERTSFADIAEAVKISRGNFYYHFKTKDEILDAVISLRLGKTKELLTQWDTDGSDPADRIRRFIHILIVNRAKIMLYGCPVGALCSELARLDHAAKAEANRIFALFREWLERQFVLLGRKPDAGVLAMRLLARSQGVATLANAFRDEDFIRREVDEICAWLEAQHPAAP
ncbi:TetR/AcrR family transcriptional regulator [Methylocystis sp. Sn-Cys]|uniref:TetR/AcrR family transcriptional regulator n=1 Tax=Methylocystis sp. Sn-Cys TaxID=1701263 RepID=UPI0019234C73|nr:TetR/AcrR family transcriptional regulator [Methylocystis sp. Sn-Cys]MBL1256371.1 TetR/AcrR family transcriptional regulator [Methylocystis sp. Sn-Cys]